MNVLERLRDHVSAHVRNDSPDRAAVGVPPEHSITLRRNLLCTDVTRERKLVVVVGDRRSVERAVRTGSGGERCTRLAHCLAQMT